MKVKLLKNVYFKLPKSTDNLKTLLELTLIHLTDKEINFLNRKNNKFNPIIDKNKLYIHLRKIIIDKNVDWNKEM